MKAQDVAITLLYLSQPNTRSLTCLVLIVIAMFISLPPVFGQATMPELTEYIHEVLPPKRSEAAICENDRLAVNYEDQAASNRKAEGPNRPFTGKRSQLVLQAALEGQFADIQRSANNMLASNSTSAIECHGMMSCPMEFDIVENLPPYIIRIACKALYEFIDGWLANTARVRNKFLRMFVLNSNVIVDGNYGDRNAGLPSYIQPCATFIHAITVAYFLWLFSLSISKNRLAGTYWENAKPTRKLGRLIVAAGSIVFWPAIYDFATNISNETIKFIYFYGADQVLMMEFAMAQTIKGGVIACGAGAMSTIAPLLANLGLPAGSFVGQAWHLCSVITFTIFCLLLIAQLVYILFVKAVQLALQTVLYVTAPVFLIFLATRNTENYAIGFVKAFLELSLWTFAWVAILKVMTIILYACLNPWYKVLASIILLQLMIQVPCLIGKARISPVSAFVSEAISFGTFSRALDRIMHMCSTLVSLGMGWLMNESGLIGRARTNWVEGEELN